MNKHEAVVDFIGNNVRRHMYINVKVCKKQNVSETFSGCTER